MRAFWVILLAVVAIVVGWRVGDHHRKVCIDLGRVGCSILPWSGHVPGSFKRAGSGSGGSGSAGSAGEVAHGIGSGVHNVGSGVSGTLGGSGGKLP